MSQNDLGLTVASLMRFSKSLHYEKTPSVESDGVSVFWNS